jgi:hypothetical protein
VSGLKKERARRRAGRESKGERHATHAAWAKGRENKGFHRSEVGVKKMSDAFIGQHGRAESINVKGAPSF